MSIENSGFGKIEGKEKFKIAKIAILEDKQDFGEKLIEVITSSEDFAGATVDWIDPAQYPREVEVTSEETESSALGSRVLSMEKFADADTNPRIEFQRDFVMDEVTRKLSRKNVPQSLIDQLSQYDLVLMDDNLSSDLMTYKGIDVYKKLPKKVKVMSISGDDVHYGLDSFRKKAIFTSPLSDQAYVEENRVQFLDKIKKILS